MESRTDVTVCHVEREVFVAKMERQLTTMRLSMICCWSRIFRFDETLLDGSETTPEHETLLIQLSALALLEQMRLLMSFMMSSSIGI